MNKNDNGNNHKPRPKRWVGCSTEEAYFGDDRKHGKEDRKRASAKDRSKYKKTDQAKKKQQIKSLKDAELRGRVLSITPQGTIVEYENKLYVCSLKGSLKKEKTEFKNLISVGDWVHFNVTTEKEGMIVHVEPRKTVFMRADQLSQRKAQLIASNIDQVLITISVVSPRLKPGLVDRYIIASQKGGMQPIIVVNKIDLLQKSSDNPLIEDEKSLYEAFLEAYSTLDIPVVSISTLTGEGIEELKEIMKDKSSVFSGQSGVGKSSLLNKVAGFNLRVGDIVEKTKKGTHTTTTTNLLQLPFGGWCIDTPGIQSFGVWDLKKNEIEQYFSEIFACGTKCKYPDCSHHTEPGCAVREAVENQEISLIRYDSYLYLMDSVSREHLRR